MGMIRMRIWLRALAAAAPMLLIAVVGTPVIFAQTQVLPAAAVAAAGAETDSSNVRLLVGRSAIVDVGTAIARVSLTSADVADAMVTSPSQLLVNGKIPGTISMFVWDRGGALRRYEVTVQRDLAQLAAQVRQLFPGEKIDVQSNGKNIVLSGTVSNKDIIEKAVNVATGYVGSREEVVTLLQLQANAPSNQVLLRVRFAEVSRSAMTELGAAFFTSPQGIDGNVGRVTTQQFAAPEFEDGKLTFSDFLNFFLFNTKNDIGLAVKALQNKGLFESLAEPNLVAESGKEASFLAGGEFPIPIAQGSGNNVAISVVFKEFGIRLSFTPTVNGNRVHLKVKPEVSTLDFGNAVALQGFRIPALTTRRTETELELENGQTFAIAGLMNNTVSSTMAKVPGIGDIPILGYLFRSKAAQKNQTELVVMITPIILANNSSGVTTELPRGPESFLAPVPENKVKPMPAPAFTPERQGASAAEATAAPARAASEQVSTPRTPSPAAAAAAVSALAPAPPRPLDATPTPATGLSDADAERRLTPQEKKAVERARHAEQVQAKEREKQAQREQAAEAKRQAAQAVADRRQADANKAEQDRLSREQAKRDGEAARRAQEEAQRQAMKDREQQKAVEEAAARLQSAEAEYQAELAKKNTP
jgi:pilus assembly protein CpaC